VPFDAFTSTPDFTPFKHKPRAIPTACTSKTKASRLATTAAMSRWDFSQPDQAPGIGAQLWEYFHPDGAPVPTAKGVGGDDDDD
jgi:hypothetical protein